MVFSTKLLLRIHVRQGKVTNTWKISVTSFLLQNWRTAMKVASNTEFCTVQGVTFTLKEYIFFKKRQFRYIIKFTYVPLNTQPFLGSKCKQERTSTWMIINGLLSDLCSLESELTELRLDLKETICVVALLI